MGLPEFDLRGQASIPFDGRFLRPGRLVDAPDPRMPLIDAVCTRRSSRSYADRPVPRETFAWLVRYAMAAPTACNEQQWKVIHIASEATIRELYLRGSASFLQHTKQCFLLCYDARSDNREWLDHVQSGAAFITTFQLLAHSVGVGSCWIGHLPDKRELQRMFDVPAAYEIIALVSYGFYRDKVKVRPRKREVEEVIMDERFSSSSGQIGKARRTIARTVARRLYYWIPVPLRRLLRERATPYEKKFYDETFD